MCVCVCNRAGLCLGFVSARSACPHSLATRVCGLSVACARSVTPARNSFAASNTRCTLHALHPSLLTSHLLLRHGQADHRAA